MQTLPHRQTLRELDLGPRYESMKQSFLAAWLWTLDQVVEGSSGRGSFRPEVTTRAQ